MELPGTYTSASITSPSFLTFQGGGMPSPQPQVITDLRSAPPFPGMYAPAEISPLRQLRTCSSPLPSLHWTDLPLPRHVCSRDHSPPSFAHLRSLSILDQPFWHTRGEVQVPMQAHDTACDEG